MARLFILLALCAFIASILAASPPSFCKCTCRTNSTIIPLSTHTSGSGDTPRAAGSTCSTCDQNFCLSLHLPICKDVDKKDVFTTCFQRDSRMDQIVVLTFIGVTIGLLCWAAVRKILEKKRGGAVGIADTQEGYVRVGGR